MHATIKIVIKNLITNFGHFYYNKLLKQIHTVSNQKRRFSSEIKGNEMQLKLNFSSLLICVSISMLFLLQNQMKEFYPLLIVVLNLWMINSYPSFDVYVDKYGKKYSEAQYLRRKQIYDARVESFSKITDYTPGVNQLTDLTEEELAVYKTLQQLPEEAHSTNQKKQVSSARLGSPASLDWRDRNVVTSIKNQGSCGCCWAFASVAYAESRLIIQGKYTADNIDLSEQFMLRCTKLSNCDGGYLEYALESVRMVPTQEKYAYSPYSGNSVDCSSDGIRSGYTVINQYTLSDDELISLLQDGPVPISISSDGWENYGSGIFQCSITARVNHAVLLIGYTPDYWIIKNQWGVNWGEDGYMKVTRNTSRNCKIGTSAHTLSSVLPLKLAAILFVLLALLIN